MLILIYRYIEIKIEKRFEVPSRVVTSRKD
jgi:hypothetical protein